MKERVLAMKKQGLSIGFVPTMGALHPGHLSLLNRSVAENDISLSSIFVNPIQFNNRQDLEKYPRSLDSDVGMLEKAGCDIVFAPSVDEMYPGEIRESYEFGALEKVMEGAKRPGHFNGVAVVVQRLFDICLPDRAYFGEKDFQQLMIIKDLVRQMQTGIEIVPCPIIREEDGLAMSSRNQRLSKEERAVAPVIYNTLLWIKKEAGKMSAYKLIAEAEKKLKQAAGMTIDYVQLADEKTLMPADSWDEADSMRAFIAVFLGEVRLIDNMKIT